MAEIKIEKKTPIWPFLLAGLIIIGLILYFLGYVGNKENSAPVAVTETIDSNLVDVKENNSTVAEYVYYIKNMNDSMTLDHTFSNMALLKLISATEAMSNEVGFDVKADLDNAKQSANNITDDPNETTHADNIKRASEIITNALQNIQQAKYSGLSNEVAEVKMASESIKNEVLTLDQKDEVKTFFNKAADLLNKMN